jgi:cytochrome c
MTALRLPAAFKHRMVPRAHRRRRAAMTALILVIMTAGLSSPVAGQDRFPPTPWGRGTAADSCVVCHSLEKGGPFRYAPNLYGIVGAPIARERDWYGYSMALRQKGGTWTEDDLDHYLADAQAFAPGTKKTIRVTDADKRHQIIEFLKTLNDR